MGILAKPWFPLAVLIGTIGAVMLAAFLPSGGANLPERPDWTGTWDTRWQAGGATLILEQRGERVTGTYPLYQGRVEARVRGRRLRGTWEQPERQGTFEMLLAADGQTFAGQFENEQYWNGARMRPGEGRNFDAPDLRAPRDTLQSFLSSVYRARRGEHDALQSAIRCIDFGPEQTVVVGTLASNVALLYEVLDRSTFTLFEIPGREAILNPEREALQLRQAGTSVEVELDLHVGEDGMWRIVWPGTEALDAKLAELLAARGEKRADPQRHNRLTSPRGTMQTFLEEAERWSAGGATIVQSCLDLSQVDASVRAIDAQLYSFTLKRVLDTIGYVHLWGIPDDPTDPLPYVHYEHALGNIVIAPKAIPDPDAGDAAEAPAMKTRWVFTAETLAGLRGLYDALEGFRGSATDHDLPRDPYFRLRQFSRSLSPSLVRRDLILENWQWIGLLVLGLGGWWIGLGVQRLLRLLFGRAGKTAPTEAPTEILRDEDLDDDGTSREWRFFVPVRLSLTAGLWLLGLRFLGLPDRLQVTLLSVSLFAGVLGLVWASIALISAVSARLLARAELTNTRLDEILVTLLASVAKIGAVVLGLVLLAEGLALPYQSVLAGIGIGGLAVAIAARDTVANFFGSAVLISDRPFKRGDLVEVMGHIGEVERVGIRSTHIRTYEDSVVVIPNSSLVNEMIDNRGRRRRRKVDVIIGVQYDSPAGKVQRLVDELRALVERQPTGYGDATLVGLWDFGSSSVDVRLWCYLEVQTLAQERIERHRLLLDVFRLVESLGLSFAFPTQTLHLESVPTSADGDGPIRLGGQPDGAAAAARD